METRRPDPNAFDAVTFDVYGTILNWEPEIAAFFSDWGNARGLSSDELLKLYDRLRRPLQEVRPALAYPDILTGTYDALANELEQEADDEARVAFRGSAGRHAPFADSRPALERLRAMGFRLAALSNVDEASFARVTQSAGLKFDIQVTAERVGAYKPDHAHFHTALSDLAAAGIPQDRVLHVAQSRRADIVPANALGLTSVWIDRPGHVFGRSGNGAESARPDFTFSSLEDLVTVLEEGVQP